MTIQNNFLSKQTNMNVPYSPKNLKCKSPITPVKFVESIWPHNMITNNPKNNEQNSSSSVDNCAD